MSDTDNLNQPNNSQSAASPSGYGKILQNAVLLRLSTARPGVRRQVSKAVVSEIIDAEMGDKGQLNVSKPIIDSEELKAVRAFDQHMREHLMKRCLPSHYKSGIYLLPIALVSEMDEKLAAWACERDALVQTFLAAYAGAGPEYEPAVDADGNETAPPAKISLVKKAEIALGELFDPLDYPKPQQLAAAFSMEYEYLAFSTPTKLAGIKADIFRREEEKAKKKWQEATDQVTTVMRGELLDLVTKLHDALKPTEGEDGQAVKKKFKASTIENVSEWITYFKDRNIADDGELAGLVEKMQTAMYGVSADVIRTDDATRAFVVNSMDKLKGELAALTENAPVRSFDMDL